MPTYTKLKGIADVTESTLCDQLEANLIEFFNWGLLGIGAFFNVSRTDDEAVLRVVENENFTKGKIWEPFKKDIIWESGIEYGLQPIAISGVYVDGVYVPSNAVGTYSHYIDYINGQVVFNTAISPDSDVRMEYSYRYFHLASADTAWFRTVMFDSFRVDDNNFTQYGSGVWSILAKNRVQLPSVVVEAVPRRTFQGYQIGGGQKVRQDILFHIFTENPWDRKTLLDIISYQNEKTIKGFNKNLIASQDKYAFTETGALSANAMTYPQMVDSLFWKNIVFQGMISQETISLPPLYQAVVRGTFEVILSEI